MKRIRYLAPVESMSGKFEQEGIKAFQSNGNAFLYGVHRNYGGNKGSTNHFGLRRYGYEGALTAAQKAVNAHFTLMSVWSLSLKVEEPDIYNQYKRQFERQAKYKTLHGYIVGKGWQYVEADPQTGEPVYTPPYPNYPGPNTGE